MNTMLPEQPPSLRQRKKAATRERIYVEALELFRHKGFAAATVEDIAEAAQVSKGTFFNYFPSKEALLQHLGERQALASAKELRATLQDPRLDSRQKLAHMLRRLAANFESDRELTRLAVFEVMKVPEHLAADPYRQLFRQALAGLLVDGQRRGDVRAGLSPTLAGSAIMGVFLQQLFEWCAAAQPYSLVQRVDEVVELVWRGLGKEAR